MSSPNLKGRYSVEKEVFLDKLKKLVALGKSKQNALDATEINDFFAGDNLGPEQMDEIYNYLEHSNIDVVPVIDDAMLADDSMLLDDLDDDYREDKDGEDIDLDAIDLLEGIGTEDPVRGAAVSGGRGLSGSVGAAAHLSVVGHRPGGGAGRRSGTGGGRSGGAGLQPGLYRLSCGLFSRQRQLAV